MKEFVDNFYMYDFARHLVEDDNDNDENEIDESECENDGENSKLDSVFIDKEISFLVIND